MRQNRLECPSGNSLRNGSLIRLLAGFGLLNASEWGCVTAFGINAFRLGGTLYVGLIGLRFLAGAVSSALFANDAGHDQRPGSPV